MSEQIDVLAVMDTVARGCALHADKCVGEVGERWAKVATVDYDEARAAVAELIEALSKIAHLNGNDYFDGGVMATRRIARAALARVQGDTP